MKIFSFILLYKKFLYKIYFSVFCFITLFSFSSCVDSSDNLEQIPSEKVLFASTSSSPLPKNSLFETALQDFLGIQSDDDLKEYIHPQIGIFINHKPGAVSIVEHFDDLEEVYTQLPHLEAYFKKFSKTIPKNEEMPQFDCENFSKKGTFYQTVSSFEEIEKGIEINEKMIEKIHSKEEKEFAKSTDQKISRVVVLTEDYLEIGFATIHGKWYMVWFNLAKFDCSA